MMFNSRRLLRLIGLTASVLCALPAYGQSSPLTPDWLTLQGFGTVGMARSSNDKADFVRDLSQANGATNTFSSRIDSMLGLQANITINDRFQAVLQGISHYRYDTTFSPELTWAFLKYEASPNLTVRAGRIGTEFYLMADSRMVGYSMLTVRPPGDFFGMLPFHYVDGMDARITYPLGNGLIRGDIYSGKTTEKLPLQDKVWSLEGSRLSSASTEYQNGPWLLRLSYARIDFQNDLPIEQLTTALRKAGARAAASAMGVANTNGLFRSIGAVYDDGKLQVQGALARTTRESGMFENDRSGYVVAGYRLGHITPFVGYSWIHSTPKPLNTGLTGAAYAALNAQVAYNVGNSHSDQRTSIIGARWDVAKNIDIKLQYDMQRGEPNSVFPVRREQTPAWNGSTNVLSLALDFIF